MNCEKIDKYDYLIAMSTLDAKNDDVEMFKSLDTSDIVLSDKIVRKIGKLIKISHKNPLRYTSKVRTVFSRVAVVALIIISITFAAMMSVSAIRNAIWNTIVEWYDKYISVDYETDNPVSVPAVIEEIRKPTLLPQGAEEEIIFGNKWSYLAEYYVGDECRLVFAQSLLNKGDAYIDSEASTMEDIKIGNYNGILLTYEKNTDMNIVWNDGEYRYTLTGYDIDSEFLIMIAQSVK